LHAFSANTSSKSVIFFKNQTFISRKATVWHSNQTNTVSKSVIWQKNHIFTLSRRSNGVHFGGNTLSRRPICDKNYPMILKHRVNGGQILGWLRLPKPLFSKRCSQLHFICDFDANVSLHTYTRIAGPLYFGCAGPRTARGPASRQPWIFSFCW